MRIAFTHNNADSDGFAALVGLRALYPGLEIMLGQRVAPRVKRLLALHREFVRPLSIKDLNPDNVELAIIADVRRRSRLPEYEGIFTRREEHATPTLIVYDHHGPAPDDLDVDKAFIEPVGATCTVVTEQLQRASLDPDTITATLLSIGIHTDTGSLNYASATPRDAQALYWLMEHGASPRLIERFLRQSLTENQRMALTQVLTSIRTVEVSGMPIAIAGVALERSVDGLASVVAQALKLTEYAAVFGVFHIRGRKAQMVARARAPELNVGAVLATFGGGGHKAAAAATIKTDDPFMLIEQLIDTVHAHAPQVLVAETVMDRQMTRIDAQATFADAEQRMQAANLDVLAVERDGGIAGTIDRDFVHAARREERMDASIASAMRHGLESVPRDLPLDQLIQRFIDVDQPAVFILEHDQPVGWILRERVLESLYKERTRTDAFVEDSI